MNQNRRNFLKLSLGTSLAILTSGCSGINSAFKKTKPNIIFIMADDLGYGDIACFGSKNIKTPNLDKLCANGMKLTDFHSNGAVCSPTRAALLTGRYQQRSGVTGVVTAKSHRHVGLNLKETTFAEILKDIGYKTALFGKWHVGYDAKFNPTKQGFDEFKGYVSGNVDFFSHVDQEGHFDWWQGDTLKDENGYVTHLITDHSIDFIQRHKDQPFCLYVPHETPHYPIQTPEDAAYRKVGGGVLPGSSYKPTYQGYVKMIEAMDAGIGQIIDKVHELSLADNTLIIFTSDNGPASLGSAGPLRGGKGSTWEGGHRVPGIAYWPGKIKPGSQSSQTILSMDMLPTFASVAGAKLPNIKFDGIDVTDVFFNNAKLPQRTLFWQHGNKSAVRKGKFKWVKDGKAKPALFDLDTDLPEKNDLSEKHPELAKQLETEYNKWLQNVTTGSEKVS
ncbi:MAG: sulfatase-like hydrolase/transferase [Phycisphaerae bacterium]|nr:sulfatase-like hydrolase/transferase [Phycisphaerae bacterium]